MKGRFGLASGDGNLHVSSIVVHKKGNEWWTSINLVWNETSCFV